MSAFDFNQDGPQREFAGSKAAPPGSILKVRLTLRHPKQGKQQGSHPLLTNSGKGSEYLDAEFEVVGGTFQGTKIWDVMLFSGQSQGQQTAASITRSRLRAMLEASRGIMPNDQSPAAAQARKINGFEDLQGIEFPIRVGAELSEPQVKNGKRVQYVNNTLDKVITPDQPEYAQVMSGADVITDNPLPEIPYQVATPAAPGAPAGAPAWGQRQPAQAAPPDQQPLPQQPQAAPPPPPPGGYVMQPDQQQPQVPAGAPNWATGTGMDDVPF